MPNERPKPKRQSGWDSLASDLGIASAQERETKHDIVEISPANDAPNPLENIAGQLQAIAAEKEDKEDIFSKAAAAERKAASESEEDIFAGFARAAEKRKKKNVFAAPLQEEYQQPAQPKEETRPASKPSVPDIFEQAAPILVQEDAKAAEAKIPWEPKKRAKQSVQESPKPLKKLEEQPLPSEPEILRPAPAKQQSLERQEKKRRFQREEEAEIISPEKLEFDEPQISSVSQRPCGRGRKLRDEKQESRHSHREDAPTKSEPPRKARRVRESAIADDADSVSSELAEIRALTKTIPSWNETVATVVEANMQRHPAKRRGR